MAIDDRDIMKQKLVSEWIARLGISNWDISVKSDCTMEEIHLILDGEDATGAVRWATLNKKAQVFILSEEEFDKLDENKKWMGKYDFEQTLVHELLHIKFAALWDSFENQFLADWFHQQGIEDMATALVEAKREGVRIGQVTQCISSKVL